MNEIKFEYLPEEINDTVMNYVVFTHIDDEKHINVRFYPGLSRFELNVYTNSYEYLVSYEFETEEETKEKIKDVIDNYWFYLLGFKK